MTMPEMAGDELTSKIHSIRPDIPVILVTGYSKKLTDKENNELGVQAILSKPYEKKSPRPQNLWVGL
jgi:CheY-like chemotaxis protein